MGISTALGAAQAVEREVQPADPARKIELLRELYSKGTYEVDAEKVAAKIIQSHLEK